MITLLIESNSILADCAVVREHYAPYHASNELSMEDEFRIACRQNNPESALIKFVKFVEQHDLFVALIQGTSHTDNLYSTTGISLLNETASCAVLAEKCRETLYPNWSDKKLSAKRNTTLARLAKIEEAFWKGRNALVTNYSTSARDDLHHMLLTEDFSPRNRQQAINEMHDFMTSKYPYRAWALIIFDEKDMWGNRISHEFFGKEEHQFIVNERELVLIAYSANRENHMCDLYRKKLHNRQLRQVLNGNYKLTSYADNLIESIFVVKEWMEEHEALPAAEFGLIAVRYSVGLVCKRDSDHKHHHLEFIQNHRNGNQVEQVFLIGWC
uniref:Uncharacterized protein n=1 Tax=Plectus sambesii TaxID=2011161 RepID=A0A914XRL2_9BILA